jgi:soluble lytic murein transglycosylase
MAEAERNGPLDEELAARIRYPLAPDWIGLPDRPVNGLDPLLVHALVRQESRFQPDALSPAGAVGLMQLMPKTARETARRAGRKRPDRWELLRPEQNVELGSRYLARLGARFGGEWMHAIAAYNGGEAATDRWVERAAGDGGRFLEGITYRETRMYVRKVLLNLLQYYRVYRPGSLARTLPTPPPTAPPGAGGDGTPPPGGEASLLPEGGSGTPAP